MLSTEELLALAIAIAFAAGLNLSAVLVTLGLLAQADILVLPGPIAIVGEWWVIGASAALFVVESFADKVPRRRSRPTAPNSRCAAASRPRRSPSRTWG